MKHVITFISQDGKEIVLDEGAKITIKNFKVGEDAVYGTTYGGSFIEEIVEGDNTLTIKFRSDYWTEKLKAIK